MILGISKLKYSPDPKHKRIALPRDSVEYKKLVQKVFKRDGYRCRYCKKIFPENELAPCHKKSVGSGGDDTEENMFTGCKECHGREHNGEFVKQAVKTYKIFD